MSNPGEADGTPVESVRQLAAYFEAGCKPAADFRIGTEHEKFGFRRADLNPPPYEPQPNDRASIRLLLEGMAGQGGEPITDNGNIIGLKQGEASISLEPAGQLELSGAALPTLHDTWTELQAHFADVRAVTQSLGMGFAPLGFHPFCRRDDMPWMPKGRYAIMRGYMPKVGSRGLDMMTRTCTVQVNLDYASERDMVRKLRVSLLLQPIATALFANSPFTEGKPNGFLSYRADVWRDTDNQRSGIPAIMLDDGFGFERYAEWLIDQVPMYFIYRNGRYIDVSGSSFRAFMQGRLHTLATETATMGDFADHVTTVFTDVRVKRFLEMRGSDAGSPEMMIAQSAFWVGLLYDEPTLTAAEALVRDMTWHDAIALREAVPRQGLNARLNTPGRGHTVRTLAREAVALARQGLRARRRLDPASRDESVFVAPLEAIADGAPTQAEHWLARYNGPWNGDIRRILTEAEV